MRSKLDCVLKENGWSWKLLLDNCARACLSLYFMYLEAIVHLNRQLHRKQMKLIRRALVPILNRIL